MAIPAENKSGPFVNVPRRRFVFTRNAASLCEAAAICGEAKTEHDNGAWLGNSRRGEVVADSVKDGDLGSGRPTRLQSLLTTGDSKRQRI